MFVDVHYEYSGLATLVFATCDRFRGASTCAVASGGPGRELLVSQPTEGPESCCVIREAC